MSFTLVALRGLYVRFTWRRAILFIFALFFLLSVFNNHEYLTQKKQLYKQQKLREKIPKECQISN